MIPCTHGIPTIDLPSDLRLKILDRLDVIESVNLSMVNKDFYESNRESRHWKRLFERDFPFQARGAYYYIKHSNYSDIYTFEASALYIQKTAYNTNKNCIVSIFLNIIAAPFLLSASPALAIPVVAGGLQLKHALSKKDDQDEHNKYLPKSIRRSTPIKFASG